jgi:Heparinase II/III-like protein
MKFNNPYSLSAPELQALIQNSAPYFPELEIDRAQPQILIRAPQTQAMLALTQPSMTNVAAIPSTPYTSYRRFTRDGDRGQYETPYFLKRERLSASALRFFLGQNLLKDTVQDYLWNICEESTWVLPAHETMNPIDLFSAETGWQLAETLLLLGNRLDIEVRHRVRMEVERRIFDPYIRQYNTFDWYKGSNNWNGVCNSSVAATFLLLEPEPSRAAYALSLALAGIKVYLDTAFEADGSSTEGVAYWQYGLMNFVVLAEMLYARSGTGLNLLDTEQIRRIAAYPARMQLSGASFASFSDCHETVQFHPGIIQRLSQRSRERSLMTVIAQPASPAKDWRLTTLLRNVFWWDGFQPPATHPDDAYLPAGAVARLVAQTPNGVPVIVMAKAGHNDENHNHNDIGSFILNVGGENLLTDPGPGLYSRQYFSPERYNNVFANSYGHSVPRIGGQLQGADHAHHGEILGVETSEPQKRLGLQLARAYSVTELTSASRWVSLQAQGPQAGTVWLEDTFSTAIPIDEEEAFITWCQVKAEGANATLIGEKHQLRLTIEAPVGMSFQVEVLEEQSKANAMLGVLKRLSFSLPQAIENIARVRMEIS